jgi:Kef-type K+ transport system membrane component KefB
MEHHMIRLVIQLSLIIITARICGFIFKRFLKQSSVLGELVAGMIIGPYGLGGLSFPMELPVIGTSLFPVLHTAIPVEADIYAFAIIASIILLFLSGLETDLPTFLRFSLQGSFVGLGGVIVSFLFGDLLAVLFLPGVNSFMHPTALFLGTLSTATSVGITARILSEKGKISSPEGVTILAGAVFDDVLGIILLAIIIGIAKMSKTPGSSVQWGDIGLIALKAFGFWIISTFLGILLAPKLTNILKKLKSKNAIAGILCGIAFLFAGISEIAGLAMIIGGYIFGLSLSQTDIAYDLRTRLKGLYEFLVPIFFVVMGMMVDFRSISNPSILIFGLVFAVVAVISKLLGCGLPALGAGFNLRGAFRIGAGMLPRGEVTLIVAGIGLASGAIGQDIFGVAIVTLFFASVIAPPLLIISLKGRNGLRKQRNEESIEEVQFRFQFPGTLITDFMCTHFLEGFKAEGFYIHPLHHETGLYHIQKEDIVFSLKQLDTEIIASSVPAYEEYLKLILLEQIVDLQDFLTSTGKIKSVSSIGTELLHTKKVSFQE